MQLEYRIRNKGITPMYLGSLRVRRTNVVFFLCKVLKEYEFTHYHYQPLKITPQARQPNII